MGGEDNSIRDWLVGEVELANEANDYAKIFKARGYETLQQLKRDVPSDVQLERWGIVGRHCVRILKNLNPANQEAVDITKRTPKIVFLVDGVVRSCVDPNLFFKCTFLIDTGCQACPVRLPHNKMQQLKLAKENTITASVSGHLKVPLDLYGPVWVELTRRSGQIIRAPVLCGAHPNVPNSPEPTKTATTLSPSTSTTTPTKHDQKPTKKQKMNNDEEDDEPDEFLADIAEMTHQGDDVVSLSPVKFPVDKPCHDEALMGPACLAVLGLDLDTKHSCLYSLQNTM